MIGNKEEELKRPDAQNQELKTIIGRLDAQNQDLRNENQNLKAIIERLDAQNQDLKNENQNLKTRVRELEARVRNLEANQGLPAPVYESQPHHRTKNDQFYLHSTRIISPCVADLQQLYVKGLTQFKTFSAIDTPVDSRDTVVQSLLYWWLKQYYLSGF